MADEIAPLLVTEKAAARLIGLSDSTLIAARFRGQPLLPFVRVSKRSIRYRLIDVHDFVDRNIEYPPPTIRVPGLVTDPSISRKRTLSISTAPGGPTENERD